MTPDTNLTSWCRVAMTLCAVVFSIRTNPASAADNLIAYARDVAPIFSTHCFHCHGPDEDARKGDLRLDRLKQVIDPSPSATTIINPGLPESSALLDRVASNDPNVRMPPLEHGGPLSASQIETLRLWIAEGASHSRHWSFVPPVRTALPAVNDANWPRTPIDHFVLAELEARELQPSPEADRHTLLRRMAFDLTGLPPALSQVEQFIRDESFDQWERQIDRLISSPQFGERMAQPWLDAARYADTTGHAADKPRTMWLFRDWVIHALNDNMPFDQFTIEQLAGDMLPNATESQLIATGFHRNSMQALGNNPRKEEFRVKGIVDRLDTTGRVWLGITIGCAECHDHKYDPISQREYYQLFAVFNNVPHLGEKFEVHGPRISVLPDLTKRKIAHLQRQLDLQTDNVAEANRLVKAIGLLRKQTVTAQTMGELEQPRPTYIHIRGNFENRGERITAAVPIVLAPTSDSAKPVDRLALAQSIVDRNSPLTARVMVNRIWKHYFGMGIVNTVDDFGIRGDPPSHPQLLDWLAVEFMESGWDIKHMHRLIVSSATYRQSSHTNERLKRVDPLNRLIARGPRMRLAAEQIRDLAVFATGKFVGTIGGPSVFPRQDPAIGQFRDDTAGKWTDSPGEGQYRRAIYTFWQRMSPYPSAVMFDAAGRERCSVNRATTNTPLQALTMLNDPYFVGLARDFGQRIVQSADTAESCIEFAFWTLLSRPPDREERRRFLAFVANEQKSDPNVSVWFRVAQVLFNLDEAITKE